MRTKIFNFSRMHEDGTETRITNYCAPTLLMAIQAFQEKGLEGLFMARELFSREEQVFRLQDGFLRFVA